MKTISTEFGNDDIRFGIVGHSAGGGTASTHPAEFPLGRVCVAGFRGVPKQTDPLFVLASAGDGVIPLARIESELATAPDGTRVKLLGGPDSPNHISFLSERTNDW